MNDLSKKKYKLIFITSIIINLILGIIIVVCGYKYVNNRKNGERVNIVAINYFEGRNSLYKKLSNKTVDVVFLGDSLTDGCEWSELVGTDAVNRGINGDTTEGLLNRLSDVTRLKPNKIFLMIGANDMILGKDVPSIFDNYKKIIKRISKETPNTKLYIQSNLPTIYKVLNDKVLELNNDLKTMPNNRNIFYIDLYSLFSTKEGNINPLYTYDGAHLNGDGYEVWKRAVSTYIK